MNRRAIAASALALALPGCTHRTPQTSSTKPTAVAASSRDVPPDVPSATASVPTAIPPTLPPPGPRTPVPTTFGAGPAWPRGSNTAAPAAYGAVLTRATAAVRSGGTLAPDLLLPRLDNNDDSPLVMTPCGRQVRLRGTDVALVAPGSGGSLPKQARDVVVLVDPGHGGGQDGAIGIDGSREADRVLALARQVASRADARLGRVYLTRNRDIEESLAFRVALGDSLRADVAVSVHLNAEPDGRLDRPGLETYGSLSNRAGRRLAGVLYEAQRRFLQRKPGPWVGDRDAGAKYRIGRRGGDYYGLLRRAHVPWVISESMFVTSAHDLALLDQPEFLAGLAGAIAGGIRSFATSRAPGSGWVRPYQRRSDPAPAPRREPPCVDPAR